MQFESGSEEDIIKLARGLARRHTGEELSLDVSGFEFREKKEEKQDWAVSVVSDSE